MRRPHMHDFAERTFGIKAKPCPPALFTPAHFAERTFGIKAKLKGALAGEDAHFAERTFGIKAKRSRHVRLELPHFAERTFGIKAKRVLWFVTELLNFAERTIGIKAKRRRRLSRSSRANTDTFNIFAKQNAKFCVVSCFQNTDTFNRAYRTQCPSRLRRSTSRRKKAPDKPSGSFFAFRGTKRSEKSGGLSDGDARTCSGTCRRVLPCRRSAFPPCTPGASPP